MLIPNVVYVLWCSIPLHQQVWGAEADAEEPASVIPPASLLLKYGAVLGGAWLGGGLVARVIRKSGASSR